MRKDFKKLLCECYRYKGYTDPRKGRKKKNQKHARGDYDEWSHPKHEPMNMGRGSKDFGENLAPLVRFLRSSVGRPWNDVYAEIKEVCPNNSAVNAHIYQHLWDYVIVKPFFIKGVPYMPPEKNFGGKLVKIEDHYFSNDRLFYVDKKGILKAAKPKKKLKRKFKTYAGTVIVGKEHFLMKENVWYKALVRKIPDGKMKTIKVNRYNGRVYTHTFMSYPKFHDILLNVKPDYEHGRCDIEQLYNFYQDKVYCYKLIQLNSKQIKKLKLNEIQDDQ